MAPIIETCRESRLLQPGLNLSFSAFFATPWQKLGHDLAVVPPANFYLLPSCSSRDSASDGVVLLCNKKRWLPDGSN